MVDLRQLLNGLAPAPPAVEVRDLTDDSRRVEPGSLFLARAGARADGRDHIADAVRRGAVGVVCDSPATGAHRRAAGNVPLVEVESLGAVTGVISERFFGEPAKRLRLIGVTGTNGKTSVAHLATGILRGMGVETACIGTLGCDLGGEVLRTGLTTPGAIELSRLLAHAVKHGARAAVIETSSHALEQGRVAALRFDVGVFTNLSRDHLDDHGDMASYGAAKARLFSGLDADALAIVNAADPSCDTMLARCDASVLRCGADATVEIARASLDHLELRLRGAWGDVAAAPALIGEFNAMNALQAFGAAQRVCELLDITTEGLAEALSGLSEPAGRLERVAAARPAVFVDYAHTPAALEAALLGLRPLTEGRLVCVFGCGGDRDRGKRPEMGRVVSELADFAVVTSDNPRTEEPAGIIADVVRGMSGNATSVVEVRRDLAIQQAIECAGDDDTVLIAGKGHEDYQLLPGGNGGVRRIRFDDRAFARTALLQRAPA